MVETIKKRPFVSANFAITADGKISTPQKVASHFTSRLDLERLWRIRKTADAILIGKNTLELDEMTMTIPECELEKQPKRLVVSRGGVFNWKHPLFSAVGGNIHLLATAPDACIQPPAEVEASVSLHYGDLEGFLEICSNKLGIEYLLCEGGAFLFRKLLEVDAIDQLYLTLAGNLLFGGENAPTLTGISQEFFQNSKLFELVEMSPQGNGECFLSYRRIRELKD